MMREAACAYCGKVTPMLQPKKKCCSDKCFQAYYYQTVTIYKRSMARLDRRPVEFVCQGCGKVALRRSGGQKFCSRKCWQGQYQRPYRLATCPICGWDFPARQQKTCSLSCGRKLMWRRRREAAV